MECRKAAQLQADAEIAIGEALEAHVSLDETATLSLTDAGIDHANSETLVRDLHVESIIAEATTRRVCG